MLVLCDNVKSKVWVGSGFIVSELLRASSQQHCNNSLTTQTTMQRMTLCSKPVEENHDRTSKEVISSECVKDWRPIYFSEKPKSICISSASWNPDPIIFFLCNCGKHAAFMVSRTLFSYFKSGCFIISSGEKYFGGSQATREGSEGRISLSRYNIKSILSRLDF